MSNCVDMYGNYRTRTFNDVYENASTFFDDYSTFASAGLDPHFENNEIVNTIFMLLSGRYGNSHIANSSEEQFKLKLFGKIFEFGPFWEKRLSIQNKLRLLSDEEIQIGTKAITDHAYNPSTEPDGPNVENGEITSVNEQHKTKYTKGKVTAYGELFYMLKQDVTEDFLRRFNNLFIQIVEPEYPLWYLTDTNEYNGGNL